jgi:hypothetical protein
MQSATLRIFKKWLSTATPDQIAFVDSVYRQCENLYECGGDYIVECFEPCEIVTHFQTLNDVRESIKWRLEQALNYRLGSDDDSELTIWNAFHKKWPE